MKACNGIKGTPLIHDLDTSWRYEIEFTPRSLYPRAPLGGSYSRFGLFAEEKFLGSVSRNVVSIPTEIPQLPSKILHVAKE
jgi:hypothetical protein